MQEKLFDEILNMLQLLYELEEDQHKKLNQEKYGSANISTQCLNSNKMCMT